MENETRIPKIPFGEEILANLKVGDIVCVTVSEPTFFGAFVLFEKEGVPVHIKGLITAPYMGDSPEQAFETHHALKEGDEMQAVVIAVSLYSEPMLSIRKSDLFNPDKFW